MYFVSFIVFLQQFTAFILIMLLVIIDYYILLGFPYVNFLPLSFCLSFSPLRRNRTWGRSFQNFEVGLLILEFQEVTLNFLHLQGYQIKVIGLRVLCPKPVFDIIL